MIIHEEIEAVFILGPSGSGKDTQVGHLLRSELRHHLVRWPSITTRERRDDDISGKYTYVSDSEMDALIAANKLVEVDTSQNKKRYATPWDTYHEAKANGKVLLKDINFGGAEAMYRLFGPKARYIYLFLSPKDTVKRLISRHNDEAKSLSPEYLEERSAMTKVENQWALEKFKPQLEVEHPNLELFFLVTAIRNEASIHRDIQRFLSPDRCHSCP